uniref:Uncharacterized protein n=1 Tax=Rhizophora mucronata TaxID=61149 RepID=A0A2P2NF76_RHIMU
MWSVYLCGGWEVGHRFI